MKFDRPLMLGILLAVCGTTVGVVAKYYFGFGDLCMSPSAIGSVIGACIGMSLMNALRSRQ